MLKPNEIEEAQFHRSNSGYNVPEVDAFLDAVYKDYSKLFNDNIEMSNRIKVLETLLAEKGYAPAPYEGDKDYIFISYSHRDKDTVFKVLDELERLGYRFWYDSGISAGSEWADVIADHLRNAHLVMAFITKASMRSYHCKSEIIYALSQDKNLLSLVYDENDLPAGLEMQLSAKQNVVRSKYASWETFVEKILSCKDLEPCKGNNGMSQ